MDKIFPVPLAQEGVEALVEQLLPGEQLQSLSLLDGSFSNETSLITTKTAAGSENRLVLRRYAVFGNYDRGEKAHREFKTLQLLNQHQVPAPTPLLLDTTGDVLGSPGIVTSYVPGRQVVIPADPANWVRQLARTLAHIHTIPLTEPERAFLLDSDREVVWFLNGGQLTNEMAAHPHGRAVWQAVHDGLATMQPAPPALVHIDYWLGNILWQDGRIAAVLDWEEAGSGDPGYDVAYLRVELAMLGGSVLANQFLAAYVAEMGHSVPNLPFWELAAAVRFMPDPAGLIAEWQTFAPINRTPASVNHHFNHFVAQALWKVNT